MILRVQGVEVGGKNRCKIDKKMESRWEDILGSVFSGFWWIFGAKLGGKNPAKTGQDRPRQAKTREGKGRERKGRGSERTGRGKVWKSVAGDFLRPGGEGFTRPLGGDPFERAP